MTVVGTKAHNFCADAVVNGNKIVNNFSLNDLLSKGEVILFFYPKDFTFVCPTELLELQTKYQEFVSRNIQLVACSIDSVESHLAWLNTPINQGGINGVQYPIISDLSKIISIKYGVLAGDYTFNENYEMEFCGAPVAYRGVFLIDKTGIIRHMSINDMPLGRSIDEILRIIDMWHSFCTNGEVCPVNWSKGSQTLKPNIEDTKKYLNDKYS